MAIHADDSIVFKECKSVRSKVVSIEGRFDRQKSIRSKTRVSSIDKSRFDRRQESVRSKTVTIA